MVKCLLFTEHTKFMLLSCCDAWCMLQCMIGKATKNMCDKTDQSKPMLMLVLCELLQG